MICLLQCQLNLITLNSLPTLQMILANDSDVDGDSLSISAVSGGVNGSVSLSNGSVTFTPTANFNGIGHLRTIPCPDGHNGFATGKRFRPSGKC